MGLVSVPFEGLQLYYPRGQPFRHFEPEFTKYLQNTLQKDMVFLDVGAHFGYYTVLAANRVRKVIAVEPKESARFVLLENIRRNELKNVSVVENPLFSRMVQGAIARKNRFQVMPNGPLKTVTLDSLHLSPDIIKIDVEGAEHDVLIGGKETLLNHHPVLLIELHPHKMSVFGHKPKDIKRFLRRLGYIITTLGVRGTCQFVRAE